ncbi:D-alanyl-D-alanine carboxypeptidase family protein [Virgibacillus byunsanensis]|uniref:D-alanyl-D-alanine carboxypeptidase family protein n=1 Tax=Virgibacillus byunsanensis TaxID=570945 RepID=A0ABW3LJE4_9BACI
MTVIITTILALNIMFVPKALSSPDTNPPLVNSEAAIMIDSDSGTALYEKNATAQMYPASLTKIATAIFAIESGKLDSVVTVSRNARETEGTRVYLEEGEKVPLKKLIQGLLINSGNDAGVAIAEHMSGSVEAFSAEINDYLENVVGIENTHLENPHGLYDPDHVTTAEDLAKLTQYAMNNEIFREIFGTKELKWNGEKWDTLLITHHKLMREMPYEGITGGKTGFVSQSGFTLATTVDREDLSLIVITLNSNMQKVAYKDTTSLLDFGFENFKTGSISEGITFMVGDQEYRTPEELFFTHTKNEQVNKEITEDGDLKLIDQDGTVLNSYHLDTVKKDKRDDPKMTMSKSQDVQTSSLFGDDFSKLILVVVILTIGIVGIIYRQVRKSEE